MSPELNILIALSVVGLLLVASVIAYRTGEWRMLIAVAVWSALVVSLLNRLFGFPRVHTVALGRKEDLVLWVALYICMVMGMLAHFGYRYFERPKRTRRKWDWGAFFAPVFASPLVFIPLATSFSDAGIDLQDFTAAKLMVFLVAFQNGFFW